jgi:hypothetical protein
MKRNEVRPLSAYRTPPNPHTRIGETRNDAECRNRAGCIFRKDLERLKTWRVLARQNTNLPSPMPRIIFRLDSQCPTVPATMARMNNETGKTRIIPGTHQTTTIIGRLSFAHTLRVKSAKYWLGLRRRRNGCRCFGRKKGVSILEMARLLLKRNQDIHDMKIEPISFGKVRSKTQPLTFGDFVAGVYQTCGKRRAKNIVHLAVAMHLIEFRGPERIVIF